MAFLQSRPWALGANFHEGALVANIPWDGYDTTGASGPYRRGDYAACPDDATYVYLAKAYAANSPPLAASRYFKDGVTNGAKWWALFFLAGRALLFFEERRALLRCAGRSSLTAVLFAIRTGPPSLLTFQMSNTTKRMHKTNNNKQ